MPKKKSKQKSTRKSSGGHGKDDQVITDPPVAGIQTHDSGIEIPQMLPILPIRGEVIFPGTIVPLVVGRQSSLRMLEESLPKSKVIALMTQRDEEQEEPGVDGLYQIGTAALVLKLIRQADETFSLLVHGLDRIQIDEVVQVSPFIMIEAEQLEEKQATGKHFDASVNQIRSEAQQLIDLTPNAPEQASTILMNIEQPGNLVDFLAANLDIDVQQKQDLLEETDIAKRLRQVHRHVSSKLEIARLQQKIQQDVQSAIGETQRKYFLREQIKAIQKELGEFEDGSRQVVEQLRQRLEEARPPEEVLSETMRELNRLEAIPPASPEYSVIMNYVELLADLPWQHGSEDNLDLDRARKILDRDHFDLEKVKRRLIEYLAVRKLNPGGRGPILCLVGPPGVGKTSLGQSVADALGRKFSRMSLGGIRDEAEIRGHRRTYIGAMPGRIIQEIRRAGTNNPVMMLDEVDKLGADFRGDPTSALLEVLDPRQNNAFVDRYLDVPFDLSQVLFICTANYMGHVPPAFQDRLEVIDIPGYTDNDKLAIARRYLVPRQLKENGLKRSQCRWQVSGLRKVIEDYTREAGVRELERQIGAVCRAVAAEVARADVRKGRNKSKELVHRIDAGRVRELLGSEKYIRELDTRTQSPGVAVGLAYTPAGGEILFIEATSYPGKGQVILTGHIGDVMKESANAALSLFKSRASQFRYNVKELSERDLHIHVPAGAVPKDGPSAGIAMFTAIASLLLNMPVAGNVAMTGEITLRGKVLPIGGIKEKSLAASRAGIRTVLLPEKNSKDLEEVDRKIKTKLHFEFVDNIDQVMLLSFGKRFERRLAGEK